ncbi:NUDIX domain-containing protein [Streptomyces griseofuscus]|uniref:NUDIX domain-containing protein n=1 Tax=Streptomyces griseofuscus TaxID=146922 RepID=UPI001C0EE307|nr:NUDIX domain-containing protein [Streptomyces griseofuscus]
MALVRLRRSVRAIVLDEGDRVLLCRFVIPEPGGAVVVWAAPGGGVERGESVLAALQRELREETGLVIDGEPPHVWHQEVIDPGHAAGYDGVINDYFLVRPRRSTRVARCPTMSSPPRTSRASAGGGCAKSPDTGVRICSHRATWPRRWRR